MTITERVGSTDTIYRSYQIADFEFRDDTEGDGFTFEGVASVVDTPYTVRDRWGEFTETIRAGAFSKTLKDSKVDVALFVNHRSQDVPMASTKGGTLRLFADPNLRVSADLDPVRSDVIIARSAIQRQELGEMSIGFRVPTKRDEWNADYTERTIHEVALDEVSIVRRGANPYTTASVRSLDELLEMFDDDVDADEVRRVIAVLEARLPTPAADPERLASLLKMWDHRLTAV